MSFKQSLRQTLIVDQEGQNCGIKLLHKIDIFSFIPVPKDRTVSTKQSIIGSSIFFVLVLAYILYDFVIFALRNPPIKESYYTLLDNTTYKLPGIAATFIEGEDLNQAYMHTQQLNFSFSQETKNKGQQKVSLPKSAFVVSKDAGNGYLLPWLSAQTKDIYNFLRTPETNGDARGLLFSTANATYLKLQVNMCNMNVASNNCSTLQQIKNITAKGRVFLFVENLPEDSPPSEKSLSSVDSFMVYNLFLVPNIYKRVTISFKAVQTVVYPDYFWRWTVEKTSRLTVDTISEAISDVTVNSTPAQSLNMLGVSFQLSPRIENNRISYVTLIDHISMWGAFWGVLFAVFALIFLGYNRSKFYKRNPEWSQFKNTVETNKLKSQEFDKSNP